jgi:hypothetical protein
MRLRRVVTAGGATVLAVVVGGVLHSVAVAPRAQERAAVDRWLQCLDCEASVLDSLVLQTSDTAFHLRQGAVVRLLGDGLRGPPDELTRNIVLQIHTAYREVAFHQGSVPDPAEADRLVARQLDNAVALYQRRAAQGLGRFARTGSSRARRYLDRALRWRAQYRRDVTRAIREALIDSIVILQGNAQVAPVSSALPVRPAVVVLSNQRAVPGVAVSFHALSGGSIARSLQSTDSAGRASGGVWTLGPAAQPNSLEVRSGPVRIFLTAASTPHP